MLIAIVLFFLLLFWIYNSTQKAAKFPSGPPRLPVVGGLPWLINGSDGNGIQAFENLRMKYGKVFGFYIGYGKFIVLSDFALVKEAFKSEHLADRPPFKPFNEFREGHKNPGLSGSTPGLAQSNGIYWQEQRRFALRNLRDLGFGKTSMNDLLQEEAMKLCSLLGAKEDMDLDLTTMLNRSIVNAVWFIISGEKMELEDPRLNELVSLINAFGANVNLSSPLTFMLPHPSMAKLPILRSIMNFDLIKDAFESVNKYIQQTVRCHQQNSDLDNPQDFIDVYLKRMQEETNIESSFSCENGFDALVSVLADLMMPGMETVSSALSWAFYFMAKHPDVQERAYQEIKQTLEEGRAPSLTDEKDMPFIRALLLEIFRSSSLTYSGIPRYSSASFNLQDGTTIPKGTVVISHAYYIMHDQSYWIDPYNFRPERFLDSSGSFKPDERVIPFGLGKRYCPAQSLAEKEFYLFFVTVLQKFRIEQAPYKIFPKHSISDTLAIGIIRQPPEHCLRMTRRN